MTGGSRFRYARIVTGRSTLLLLAAAISPAARAQFAPEQLRLVGAAELHDGHVRLTPARPEVAGAAWAVMKQSVAAGFDTEFRFQLTAEGGLGPGADGFAFVLQNAGPDALAGRGAAGGFALGDGYGRADKPGIPHSIAVFFDTFRNEHEPSDNYIAVCTNGAIGNMRWPPPRLAVSRKLKTRLKDRRAHTAAVHYSRPLLTVVVDDVEVVRAVVDLSTVVDQDGAAYIGFTASTGAGYENHDILDWRFTPQVTSSMFVVQSAIDYQKTNCLEGKNLCTPAEATVETRGPGQYHIVLPGNREWGASIPNPEGREVEIGNPQGVVCGKLRGADDDCASSAGMPAVPGAPGIDAPEKSPGSLVMKLENGRTFFSVNGRKGEFAGNQGFFEFDATLK